MAYSEQYSMFSMSVQVQIQEHFQVQVQYAVYTVCNVSGAVCCLQNMKILQLKQVKSNYFIFHNYFS